MFIFDPCMKNYSLGGSRISTTFSLYIMLGKSCYLNVELAGVVNNFLLPSVGRKCE